MRSILAELATSVRTFIDETSICGMFSDTLAFWVDLSVFALRCTSDVSCGCYFLLVLYGTRDYFKVTTDWEILYLPLFEACISIGPDIRQDYPLNLSILLSGGKETNKDFPSNGE